MQAIWSPERDSNTRFYSFAGCCLGPLGHLGIENLYYIILWWSGRESNPRSFRLPGHYSRPTYNLENALPLLFECHLVTKAAIGAICKPCVICDLRMGTRFTESPSIIRSAFPLSHRPISQLYVQLAISQALNLERVGEIESHSAQLGRLATNL
jgi:hypothetical protein